MSVPNPVPNPVQTPLPSPINSGIIKALLVALGSLVSAIGVVFFKLNAEEFAEKWELITSALVVLIAVGWPIGQAMYSRLYKATPPITQQAIVATEIREQKIADASTTAMKEEAAK